VTGPPESDSAPPAEVAEGKESPAAAQASSSQSAAALSGAGSASELPGVHSQVSQAASAKHVGQDSSEAERTAPPAATEAASTSAPPAGKLHLGLRTCSCQAHAFWLTCRQLLNACSLTYTCMQVETYA